MNEGTDISGILSKYNVGKTIFFFLVRSLDVLLLEEPDPQSLLCWHFQINSRI